MLTKVVQDLNWLTVIVNEGGALGFEMNERMMKLKGFSSLTPISKWEIVGHIFNLGLKVVYGCGDEVV